MVLYELYVQKFAKNFIGLTDKLEYLCDLGVDCVWVLPHYPSPMIDDGYDVSDYFSVREELGTLNHFKDFVERAHKLNIKVIIDWVVGHTSTLHPWFLDASASKKNEKREYYLWSKDKTKFKKGINAFPHLKDSNWIYNPLTDDYYYATFYPQQPDLNWDNPQVFEEMQRYLAFWLDIGVDGFRVDAVTHMIKREGTKCYNEPEVHSTMKRFRSWLGRNYPYAFLIAEASGTPHDLLAYFGQGDEFHSAFNFNLRKYLLYGLLSGDYHLFKDYIDTCYLDLPTGTYWTTVLTNHDEINFENLTKKQRTLVLSTMDSTKTFEFRAGEGTAQRLMSALHEDRELFERAFRMQFEQPGHQVIYYGEELGMTNAQLDKKPLDTRLYVRQNFDWDDALRQKNDPGSPYSFVKNLIQKHNTSTRLT